jgi:putative ABC transport system permease protein
MIKNYFLIAFRNIFRQKGYSVINILGLSIGLMSCLFIIMFIADELSYDKYQVNGDKIYRFVVNYHNPDGKGMSYPIHTYRLREAVMTEFPEIKKITRITDPDETEFKYMENKQLLETAAVDPDFFDIFSIDMLAGNKVTAIEGPGTAIISEQSAKRLFGDEDPMGKTITIMGEFPVNITGIFKDFPKTSHFHLDAMVSTKATDQIFNERQLYSWGEGICYVYAIIDNKRELESITKRFPEFVEKVRGNGASEGISYYLQPLLDIHLKSNLRTEMEPNSDIRYIYIFGVVALFILLIATFNYMNLSTARSIRRSKEVGVRKAIGARRPQLIIQFAGEAVIFAFISMWLALLFAEFFMPYFNNLSGKNLEIEILNNWKLMGLLIVASIIIGILSGIYPAFFLSRFKPINALYGKVGKISSSSNLRKVLVIIQFSVSIFLIISTIAIYSQWKFMRNAKLGINPENILVIPSPGDDFRTFKDELLKDPGIVSVTALNKKPTGRLSSNLGFKAEGMAEDANYSIKIVTVDWDFFETIENKIVAGRSFNKKFPSDEKDCFILNEAAVKLIGWDVNNAPGKWFETSTLDSAGVNFVKRKGTVLGVAQDFYFESLHNEIRPVVYFIQKNWINWMLIRIKSADIQNTVSVIKNEWTKFSENGNFSYSFYDDDIEKLYQSEKHFFSIFISFACLAIFIASLGIMGLISFTAEQRTKEIGIRKTMGASSSKIISLLAADFMKLVLISNIIAWPVAYYFIRQWLQSFPAKINISIWIFFLSALVGLTIALVSIFIQAYKAATTNPAKALKYE